jgi:pimeloyl-ACP methyl ester carboxylesterase
MARATSSLVVGEPVTVEVGSVGLHGDLSIAEHARGIVLFAHGSGSSRQSPRNQFVAAQLRECGLATLLFDLLTEEEEAIDRRTAKLRFDIGLLGDRLIGATEWVVEHSQATGLPIGYFGASTGAAAALAAAGSRPELIQAIVSRGGRPDLAGGVLAAVKAPTLLIVGANDDTVIGLNQRALARLEAPIKELIIVPDASHLFEEPGTLEEVARLARYWFERYLIAPQRPKSGGDEASRTSTLR